MNVLRDGLGGKIRFLLLLVILFAAGVCGANVGSTLWRDWHTPPQERVAEALNYALDAPMYCYTSEAVRVQDGTEQVITRLKGEKYGDNVHLYGTADLLDTEIDVYQIGDTFYRRDLISERWMQMAGQNIEATEYLLQEINPLGCLRITEDAQVTVLGKEKLNGSSCKKYQVQCSGESSFLTSIWSEFYYTVWIDKKHRLQQVEVIADDHEIGTEQLRLLIQFDWDTAIEELKAPV